MERLEKLVKTIVEALIEEEAVIELKEEESVNILVKVSEDKIARLIGHKGKTAENIRGLVRGLKDTNKKVYIRFEIK